MIITIITIQQQQQAANRGLIWLVEVRLSHLIWDSEEKPLLSSWAFSSPSSLSNSRFTSSRPSPLTSSCGPLR